MGVRTGTQCSRTTFTPSTKRLWLAPYLVDEHARNTSYSVQNFSGKCATERAVRQPKLTDRLAGTAAQAPLLLLRLVSFRFLLLLICAVSVLQVLVMCSCVSIPRPGGVPACANCFSFMCS